MGVMMGFKIEKFDKKVTYDIFREKLVTYICRKFEECDYVTGFVKEYEDLITFFENDHEFTALDDKEKDEERERKK